MPIQLTPEVLKQITKKKLRYISDDIPGIQRKGSGKGFYYLDPNGVKISNANTIQRIEELAIPPAWQDVWISPYTHGHLQATGLDAKGRKQYLYHPDWLEISQEHKFEHLGTFCKALPKIRSQVKNDLRLTALEKRKVLATVVWLLEHTFIRVGNAEYAEENDSYGLTTLRNKHVTVRGKKVKFNFKGKSSVEHSVEVVNPVIIRTIKECLELPGYELFQYLDDQEEKRSIDSGEVNDYLQEITGEDITAKDFRTWGATLLSADILYKLGPYPDQATLKSNLTETVKEVAEHLRNTPSVCRLYYIHPVIFETYEKKELGSFIDSHIHRHKPNQLSSFEQTVVTLLSI